MDKNTLKVIDRTLTYLLSSEDVDDSENDVNGIIRAAVEKLQMMCNRLLINALPRNKNLSNIEGKRMSDTINPALPAFISSPPMTELSRENKKKVLGTAIKKYQDYLISLRIMDLSGPWGEYERRTYQTLVSALQSSSVGLPKDK